MRYFNRREAAREIGVPYSSFERLVEYGKLPPPGRKLGGARRYYSEADLKVLRTLTADRGTKWRHDGHFNMAQAAARLRVPLATLKLWVMTGKVAAPKRRFPGNPYTYWNDAELAAIRRSRRDYFVKRIPLLQPEVVDLLVEGVVVRARLAVLLGVTVGVQARHGLKVVLLVEEVSVGQVVTVKAVGPVGHVPAATRTDAVLFCKLKPPDVAPSVGAQVGVV